MMEWLAFAASALTAICALIGTYMSNRKTSVLMAYRIEQLEKKVEAHNQIVERTVKLEQKVEDLSKGAKAS